MSERFILQKSESPGKWVCTDTQNGVVCVFEHGRFNGTQTFSILDDIEKPDANKLAQLAGEMGDWLRNNHYDKLFIL